MQTLSFIKADTLGSLLCKHSGLNFSNKSVINDQYYICQKKSIVLFYLLTCLLSLLTLIGMREGTFIPLCFLDWILSAEFLSKLSKLFWR